MTQRRGAMMEKCERLVARARRHALDPRIVMAGLFVLALVPLIVTPVLPLIDFHNHLARFFILSHADSNPLLRDNYEITWTLVPDLAGDILVSPILRIIPPMAAGHIVAVGIFAMIYCGALYLNRALTGRRSLLVAVLLLPLLYSYIFNWGFINFLFGLGLAFWAAGWWLLHRNRPLLAVPVSCLLAVLIFLAHGIAFGIYGIMLASLEAGFFLSKPRRSFSELIRPFALAGVQAVLPVALFVVWKLNTAVPHAASTAAAHAFPAGAGIPAGYFSLYRLNTLLRVEEGPSYWFDVATLFIQAAAIIFLIWRGRLSVARQAWFALVVAAISIAVVPSMLFRAWYVSDRIPLFAALLFLSTLSLRPAARSMGVRLAGGILVAVVFLRLGAIAISWHGYGESYREFQAVAEKIPQGSRVWGIMAGSGNHETEVPRCEMFPPMMATQYGSVTPIFADKTQHPVILSGLLKVSQDKMTVLMPVPADERTTDYNPYMRAAAAAGFEYLLVCNTQLLPRPFPEGMTIVARTPHFAVLRTNR